MKIHKNFIILFGTIGLVMIGYFIFQIVSVKDVDISDGGDLIINKSEITSQAKFYPYQAGKIYMEVIAVKANDGSIRTALNTCQVCNNSGRGYYEQVGDVLVCQNCGNRFRIDQVEVVKGGCNPVPIFKENKSEDNEYIIVAEDFLIQNKNLFSKWGK